MWYRVQWYPYIKDNLSLIQKKNYYLFVHFWFTNISFVLFSIDLFSSVKRTMFVNLVVTLAQFILQGLRNWKLTACVKIIKPLRTSVKSP